ncbi:hypothetical protein AURDEDRAFT_173170 [Auricularia subglabra TFB-10046 SS5]|nr:hypothetical protein AURDEDRAFT_173170 [Auricularia subglabra TFB-10046 SS5]
MSAASYAIQPLRIVSASFIDPAVQPARSFSRHKGLDVIATGFAQQARGDVLRWSRECRGFHQARITAYNALASPMSEW